MAYTKKTWSDGDGISASGLNNMENGIADAYTYDDTTTQLGATTMQSAVEKLNTLVNGKVRVVEAQISGTTDANGNIGVGDKMVVGTKFPNFLTTIYYHGSYGTYIHFQQWTGTSVTSRDVSGSYFYLA